MVAIPGGLPVGFALNGAKADERQLLLAIFDAEPGLLAQRPGHTLIGDKNNYGRDFEAALADAGAHLLRPARNGEPGRAGSCLFQPLRQVIESINETFNGQLDLERHGGHTPAGAVTRVLQRILARTAAIWHNEHAGQPVNRSLLAWLAAAVLGTLVATAALITVPARLGTRQPVGEVLQSETACPLRARVGHGDAVAIRGRCGDEGAWRVPSAPGERAGLWPIPARPVAPNVKEPRDGS